MKKFTTFLSVLALMLVSVCANAQSFANGDYYFYNVEAGGWLAGANSWGTQASIVAHPHRFGLTQVSEGVYTLNSFTWEKDAKKSFLNGNFIDGYAQNCTITDLGDGTYSLTNDGAKLGGTAVGTACTTDGTGNVWKIYSEADMIKGLKTGDITDATFFIKNPDFSRFNRDMSFWAVAPGNGNAGQAGYRENMNAEMWGGNSKTFVSAQTFSVPNGKYKLTVQGFYRYNNTAENTNDVAVAARKEGTEVINSYLFANDVMTPLMSIADEETVAAFGKLPFSQADAKAAFEMGLYKNELEVVVTDGSLTVGVKKTSHPGTDWTVWDNFGLEIIEYTPLLGEPVFTPADGSAMAPENLKSIKVAYPKAEVPTELGFSASVEWILYQGTGTSKKEIKSGEGPLDVTGLEVSVDPVVGQTYTLAVFPTLNKADGSAVDSRDDEASVKTLTLTELAEDEYEKTLAEAEEYRDYAADHIGVGLKLYLPAKYAKYKKDLALAESLSDNYVTYNDYKEGTMLIRALMMEFQPQLPVVNQRYLIRHQASGLYLNATTGESVTLAETGTPVAFHHAEGAMDDAVYYMYSTPDRKYINYTGENKWSLTNHKVSKDGGLWAINRHCVIDATSNKRTAAYYTIDGMNGALGTDAVAAASSIFGNKAQSAANSHWDIIPYTEPEISADELAPGDYIIRNRETGAYLGGANSWGTQASVLKHGQTFTVAILEDGKYTLDSHTYNNAANHYLGDNAFIDSPAFGFTIEPTGDGYFTIANGDNFVSAPAEGNVVVIEAYADAKSQWQFMTVEDLLAEVAAGQSDDLTSLIKNANFSRNSYAKAYSNGSQQVLDAAFPWTAEAANFNLMGGDNTNMCAESWRSNNGFNVYQTVEVPNGYYLLKAQAAINNYEGMTEGLPVLYGNDDATEFDVMTEGESSMAMMSASFDKGMYEVSVVVKVTTGKLTVGVKSPLTNVWAVWDNFELYTSSEAEYALQAAVKANTAEVEATEISSVSSSASPVAVFSANGAQLKSMQKGMNIVKMSDGQVKKVFIK